MRNPLPDAALQGLAIGAAAVWALATAAAIFCALLGK